MRFVSLLFTMLLTMTASVQASGPEGQLPAAEVKSGATVLTFVPEKDVVVSGLYLRLTNCIPPDEDVAVALRYKDTLSTGEGQDSCRAAASEDFLPTTYA